MDIIKWGLAIILAFLIGVLFLNYLTVHPLQMSLYLFLTSLALFAWAVVVAKGFTLKLMPLPVLASLAVFVGGYALAANTFLSREDNRPLPALERAKGDPGKGHTAVIYFTHGEPPTYDPIGWLNQFREFDEREIAFVPFLARPFFVYQLRNHYLTVGKSDHRMMHQRMMNSLEKEFRQAGDTTTRFYISFLDDNPRPDAAVIQALNDGASHIVVSEVFLTISNHTLEGEELIREVGVEEYGATLAFTGPLWNSATLKSMFVDRVNKNLGGIDKSKVGVLLVGHGQPDEFDKEWPTETEQEISFREGVLDELEKDGFRRENISLAWMEFKEPQPAEKIEEFVANGVVDIFYFAAAISADSIHSQYDIPHLVNEAKAPSGVQRVNLGAWNDDPIVIRAIKEKIDPLIVP